MQPRRTPLTIAHANVVLLISMVLVLGGSLAVAGWSTYWVLAIRELLFILLPACAVVLLLKLPAQEKARLVRLRWPGGRTAAMSALIGAGGWLVDSWLGVVGVEWLGYTAPLPPDFFPTTPGHALVLFFVLAILAPICEETLFRGLIQRGYEELSPRAAILAGGALFALFHQSLPQGLALLPLAFTLGYVVWRSDSLFAGIIAHATNNALAGVLIVAATADPEIASWIGTLPAALAGLALAAIGLWGVRRWTAAPPPKAAVETIGIKRGVRFWLVRVWPFLLIVPIALFSIGLEAAMGRFPEALALGRPVRWAPPPWNASRVWTYEIRTAPAADGEAVGQVRCSLTLGDTAYTLACSRQQAAYEADTGGDVDEQWTARWQRTSLRLSAVNRHTQIIAADGQAMSYESLVTPGANAVEVITRRGNGAPAETRLPLAPAVSRLAPGRVQAPTVLESGEWPWRLSALPFDVFGSAQATMVDPNAWPEETGQSGPTAERTHVVVYGAEPVKTPAGTFIAWRVRVGDDRTAWYDVEPPHTLVALENGAETWVLVSVE